MSKFLLYSAAALSLAINTARAKLLTNGGFEAGNFSGWTQSGNTSSTGVVGGGFDGYVPHSGTYFAALGPAGSDGFLSQSFADVAGQALNVGFYLANSGFLSNDGGIPNEFAVSFDGVTLLSVTDLGVQPYISYSYNVIGTGSDRIRIALRNDSDFFALDDVSVTSATVPEPASLALVSTGLLGLRLMRRRRLQNHMAKSHKGCQRSRTRTPPKRILLS